MKQASQLFSDQDKSRIAEAISQAEAQTSAEIVPVVATASGRYDRAEDIVGVLGAIVLFSIAWVTCPVFQVSPDWSADATLPLSAYLTVLASIILGFALGSTLATKIPAFRLPFIPAREIDEEIERAARVAFMSSRIRDTRGGNGILLFVSLYEHRVRVLPDDAILKALPEQDWQVICDLIVTGMKSDEPVDALAQAIARCGEILSEPFPHQEDDKDELTNTLVLIDS